MAMRFLADYSVPQLRDDVPEQQPRHFVIDSQFHTQPYRKAFSERHFSFSSPAMFFKTRLGSFLQALGKGLEAMLSINGKKFVKLDWLLQAIAIPGFITYFQPSGSDLQRDNLIGWLCHLAEQNVLYLDFELNIASFPSCKPQQADSEAPLKDLFALLEQIDSITSISDLIAILDSPSGIRVGSLITEQESNCSDLSRCFYEAVANFYALEELKLVENWQALYPETSLAAGIFDLFLHFLKPRTYNLYRFVPEGNKAIITNLMDTRNLRAEQITFLNLVEGELPSRRTPVWLFNDKQNQHFGLKTWDDLRRWERYYFFRLLSAAKDVLLYTINNQGKNIEPSSFLAELYLFARENPGSGVTWTTDTLSAKTLLTHWVKSSPLHTLAQPAGIPAQNPPAFFHLPFQPERDFPHHNQIKLSWSSCERFIRNSFGFYLRDVAKLKERQTRIEETLNRKMFGILLHQYLMKITTRLAEQHQGILSMKWEWINHQFLRENLSSTLTHPLLTYQLPQNYNADYLTAFLSPFLIETAYWFFRTELAGDVDFTGEIITLIPETGDMTDLESQYKILPLPPLVENVLPDSSGNLPPVQNDKSCSMFQIKIRGIADLRLETPPKRFIIDFKTGDSDLLQLLFYMWFYYLIDQPDLAGKVRAGIYKLMDKQLHWLDYKQIQNPEKLPQAILQALIDISSEGYKPAADAKQKRYFASVSRSDLIPKMPTEEEEE
jgi:hypothetical protein